MRGSTISRKLLAVFLAFVMVLTCVPEALAEESATATTMHLAKTEGTVEVSNSSGRGLTLIKNMLLRNGYKVATEETSYAWVNLDSAKLAKLDAVSEMSVRKSGKKLELLLDSGNIYFNVSKPLDEDESLNIRTSTMIVGIRGTSGWVRVVDKWTSEIAILEGTVEVSVTDPVTGDVETAAISAGEMGTCVVHPKEHSGKKAEIIRQEFTADMIPGFVRVELASGDPMRGTDPEDRLKRDQEEVHERLEEIRQQLEEQDNNVSTDPVWGAPPAEDSGGSGAPTAPSQPQETPLMMKLTDDEANALLAQHDVVSVLANPALDALGNTLEVDSGLAVPVGKTLTLQSGIAVSVYPGQTMQVDGTMNVGGSVANDGNIGVTSRNTLRVRDDLVNRQSLSVSATGHIVVDGAFVQQGAVSLAQGALVQAKTFDMRVGITDWKVSEEADSAGYYRLVYSPEGESGIFTITLDPGDGSDPVVLVTGPDGKLPYLPTPDPREGYTFDGWFTEDGTQVTTDTVFTEDVTIRPHWTPETHTVTFDPTGGNWSGSTENQVLSVPYNGTLENRMPAVPTRDGYTFSGWYTALSGGGALFTEGTRVTGDLVLYANWTPDGGTPTPTTYRIAFDANGGTVSPTSAETGADGTLDSLPVPVKTGVLFDVSGPYEYGFAGWYTAADGGTLVSTDTVFMEDTMVYAHWEDVGRFTITFDPGAEGSVDRTTQITKSDGTLEPPLPTATRPGAEPSDFWVTEADWPAVSAVFTRDATVHIAEWVVVEPPPPEGIRDFLIVFDPNGGNWNGSAENFETAVQEGYPLKNGQMPEDPVRDGYTFAGWFTDPANGTQITWDTVVSEDSIFYAHWTDSGTGGVAWRMDGTTLYIEGSGQMSDYSLVNPNRPPWASETIGSVIIADGVTSIGAYAFYGCRQLASVSIPASVTSIGDHAFDGCNSLGSVSIPDSVESIGYGAFNGCSVLTSATIGNRVRTIDDYAFSGCSQLTSVAIPSSVNSIGGNAFRECADLASVTIAEGVETIGYQAFIRCASLTGLTIPSSMTSIGGSAFDGCTSLESVEIKNGLTTISEDMFGGCTGLTSVTIPDSVTSVGRLAFNGCTSLTDVYYGGTEAQWNAITLGTGNDSLTNATIHYKSSGTTASVQSFAFSAAPGYTDVPPDAWYAEAVAFCRENGLMNGTSSTAFFPNATLTRAMMVTVLHRLAWLPAAGTTAAFSDVADDAWCAEAVAWASGRGIVLGYPDGRFGPDDPVTHEQAALIFQRYGGSEDITITGADEPRSPATRAEIAVALMEYAMANASGMDVMISPSGIILDEDGTLLVTDVYGKLVWRVRNRISTTYAGGQTVLDLYGQPLGGYNDAGLPESYFKEPWAIAPFLDGWAVSDAENGVVRLVRRDVTQTLNGSTRENLKVTELGVAFERPTGLAADDGGNLYISDTFAGAVRRITPEGRVTTVAKDLSEPTGLFWKDGALYIAETGGNRIVKLENGRISTVAGSGEAALTDGDARQAAFDAPQSVAVGPDGSVYVSDTGNGAVRRIKDGEVTTIAVRDMTTIERD